MIELFAQKFPSVFPHLDDIRLGAVTQTKKVLNFDGHVKSKPRKVDVPG